MAQQEIRHILHLVDQISPVNFGIWHAAIAMSSAHKEMGIETWLVAPEGEHSVDKEQFPNLKIYRFGDSPVPEWLAFLKEFQISQTLVVSHGCWQWPTKLGALAKNKGFNWIYTPHGMLEPWSLSQKWLKKKAYFLLIEGRLARKANWVRAVGKPEAQNLKRIFKQVRHIPNGIYEKDLQADAPKLAPAVFLYLARLHHKKNPLLLAKGWISIPLEQKRGSELWIVGTDDGEQLELEKLIRENPSASIRFLGACFGEKKAEILRQSSFYVLPSQSEGFPTSVVEAMASGLIPLISDGCNFPEAFENGHAIRCNPDFAGICDALKKALEIREAERKKRSAQVFAFAREKYLWTTIASDFLLAAEAD